MVQRKSRENIFPEKNCMAHSNKRFKREKIILKPCDF